MTDIRAEIISIGDEITSGIRLDTNTQWLSQRLGEIGITVAFHSTAGDDLQDIIDVFAIASRRVSIIVATGGLGPTADDLTRQAIASMAGVDLVKVESVLNHIKQMYEQRGREMPPNNEIQAWFPAGADIIDNPEGTAPGIDLQGTHPQHPPFRCFALPGVPVEMKQMWLATVEPALRTMTGPNQIIHHHTIHCFGSGESQIETLLPNVIRRGRDPQVGITASSATISLRVTTRGNSIDHCMQKMDPTIKVIQECLGELVFGQNGEEIQDVVVDLLAKHNKTVAIRDAGLSGAVSELIANRESGKRILVGSNTTDANPFNEPAEAAAMMAQQLQADFGLAIGAIDRDPKVIESGQSFYTVGIADGETTYEKQFRYSGHSGWREDRAIKEVLNFFRLHLARKFQ